MYNIMYHTTELIACPATHATRRHQICRLTVHRPGRHATAVAPRHLWTSVVHKIGRRVVVPRGGHPVVRWGLGSKGGHVGPVAHVAPSSAPVVSAGPQRTARPVVRRSGHRSVTAARLVHPCATERSRGYGRQFNYSRLQIETTVKSFSGPASSVRFLLSTTLRCASGRQRAHAGGRACKKCPAVIRSPQTIERVADGLTARPQHVSSHLVPADQHVRGSHPVQRSHAVGSHHVRPHSIWPHPVRSHHVWSHSIWSHHVRSHTVWSHTIQSHAHTIWSHPIRSHPVRSHHIWPHPIWSYFVWSHTVRSHSIQRSDRKSVV